MATKNHMRFLLKEYGKELYLINLVKTGEKSPGESRLESEYKKAVSFINRENAVT